MKKCNENVMFSLLILSVCYGITMAVDSPCGDWEQYKDEKCLKVFEKVESEMEASQTCKQYSGSLICIRSKDEQEFLSNFLFKTHKVIDNVWIGGKRTNNKFKWIDDSDLTFTNWAEKNPQKEPGYDCIQMQSDVSSMGKWINEPCGRKNLVVCEKMQTWSTTRLHKALLDVKNELQLQISNQQKTINSQKSIIDNLKQNLVPIGFTYVQLPKDKSPTEIWPSMKWDDVSSAYADIFFRVTGEKSAPFGEIQDDNSPQLSKVWYKNSEQTGSLSDWQNIETVKGGISPSSYSKNWAWNIQEIKVEMSGGEVRPRNMAVRIWKRSA